MLGPLVKSGGNEDIVYGMVSQGSNLLCEPQKASQTPTWAQYFNIRDPWIIHEFLRKNVDDLKVVG